MHERWRWVGIGFLAWAMYVNQGNSWAVQQRFETEAECAAVAKDYAVARNVQAGCAIERTTFKLHVWPKGAATWSKKVQEFTSYDDCKAAAWVQKQKGHAATCDTQ